MAEKQNQTGLDRSRVLDHLSATKSSSTVILDVKMAYFAPFFAPCGPFCGSQSQRRAPDDGLVLLLRVIPKISGSTRNFGFSRNIG